MWQETLQALLLKCNKDYFFTKKHLSYRKTTTIIHLTTNRDGCKISYKICNSFGIISSRITTCTVTERRVRM